MEDNESILDTPMTDNEVALEVLKGMYFYIGNGVLEMDPEKESEEEIGKLYLETRSLEIAIDCLGKDVAPAAPMDFGEVMKLKPDDVFWIERSNVAMPHPDSLEVNEFISAEEGMRMLTSFGRRLDAKRYNYYVPGRIDGWRAWTKRPTQEQMKEWKWKKNP